MKFILSFHLILWYFYIFRYTAKQKYTHMFSHMNNISLAYISIINYNKNKMQSTILWNGLVNDFSHTVKKLHTLLVNKLPLLTYLTATGERKEEAIFIMYISNKLFTCLFLLSNHWSITWWNYGCVWWSPSQ